MTAWEICHRSTYHACAAQCRVPLSINRQLPLLLILYSAHAMLPYLYQHGAPPHSQYHVCNLMYDTVYGLRDQTQRANILTWMVIRHKPHVYFPHAEGQNSALSHLHVDISMKNSVIKGKWNIKPTNTCTNMEKAILIPIIFPFMYLFTSLLYYKNHLS